MEQELKASSIVNAVPRLKIIEQDGLTIEYGVKDDHIVYHVFNTDRLRLVQEAEENLRKLPSHPRNTEAVHKHLQASLDRHPWQRGVLQMLENLFDAKFPTAAAIKIEYCPEVDSCSVLIPKPDIPTGYPQEYLDKVAKEIKLS